MSTPVLDLRPHLASERASLVERLRTLTHRHWELDTECPKWSVVELVVHLLGDDLSLLSRQRDHATNGVLLYGFDHAGSDFGQLLDGFNEQWVHAARFLSPELLVELLEWTGSQTAGYFASVDLEAAGEPVAFFGASGQSSPVWQAIAREYVERWTHHHQIARALGHRTIDAALDAPAIHASVLGLLGRIPNLYGFRIAEMTWGSDHGLDVELDAERAVPVLSRGLTFDQTRSALTGDPIIVETISSQMCRRP